MQGRSWVWLYGPSGAGKTAVGYELFSRLAADRRTAFFDIDQLGMCAPLAGAEGSQLKPDNLLTLLDGFREAGADLVVVSGDIAGPAMNDVLLRARHDPPLLCRLSAAEATLVGRLQDRGAPAEHAEDVGAYDRLFEPPPADITVETDGRSIADIAELLRERVRDTVVSQGRGGATPPPGGGDPPDVVSLICGPPAVGKSTVAWEVFLRTALEQGTTAFVDLAQVGFFRPPRADDPAGHRLKAANAARLWRNFARRGARRFILCGRLNNPGDADIYRETFGSTLTVTLLSASERNIHQRAAARAAGSGPNLPGDELRLAGPTEIERTATESAKLSEELVRAGFPDHVIDTDGRSAGDVAEEILTLETDGAMQPTRNAHDRRKPDRT